MLAVEGKLIVEREGEKPRVKESRGTEFIEPVANNKHPTLKVL